MPLFSISTTPASNIISESVEPKTVLENDVATEETPGTPELPLTRWILVGLGLSLGLFMAMLDSSIVATSLYKIGADFDGLDDVNWVALSYTLAYLGLAVVIARISDVVGRQTAFLGSMIFFTVFSVGCALSTTLNQLIVFRALQGIGGSGLYSLSMVIYPEMTPLKMQKSIAIIIGLVIAAAGALGPVLGGLLTEYKSWNWVFWINVPICGAASILLFIVWPDKKYLPHNRRSSWADVDYVGALLIISASVLVVFAFQYTGDQESKNMAGSGWSKWSFIVPLVFGATLWAALVGWEIFAEKKWGDSLLSAFPLVLFQNRAYWAVVLYTTLVGFPFFMVIFSFPLRLQVVNELSPFQAGIRLLSLLGGSALGSAAGGIINGEANWVCETLAVSGCLMAVGHGLLTTMESSPNLTPSSYAYLGLVGLGFGAAAAAATMLTIMESPIRHIAPAQGIVAQARLFGGSIGIAVSTAVLGIQRKALIKDGVVTQQQLAHLGIDAHMTLANMDNATREKARRAFADVFTTNMKVSAIVAGLSVVVSLAIFTPYKSRLPHHKKKQKLEAEEAAYRRLHKA